MNEGHVRESFEGWEQESQPSFLRLIMIPTSQRTATKRNQRESAGLCPECGERPPTEGKRCCKPCRDCRREWWRRSKYRSRYEQIRAQDRCAVVRHYGGRCRCCGETQTEFLAIDHIAGNGNAERRELGRAGSSFFRWLIQQGFPHGYQVLCHNCNMGKAHNGGACPHHRAPVSPPVEATLPLFIAGV